MEIITVSPGDTVYSVALKYGLSAERIIADNGLDTDGYIVPGQSLILLFPSDLYTSDDDAESLTGVSLETGITERTILRNNIILNGRKELFQGEQIVLKYTDKPSLTKIIGGYAYDSIPQKLLNQTASYMTYIIPFTYGFTTDGELISPDDERLLKTALSYGAMPLMHISTLTEYGNFSNELAHSLLTNKEAIENLYKNILNTVRAKGFYGADVDFEFLFAEDKERYTEFIAGLTALLRPNGFITVAAVPPKTSDDQPGLLYEGIDYAGLGKSADYVMSMTYEWGYKYGPPLAVAPINSVKNVIEYAVSRIPNEKIILGISNYGYDWVLPFIRGESEAISLSTVTALRTAQKYGAEIMFDETAQAPYFYYTDSADAEHVVWFEDARSFRAKTDIIKEYGLAGGFIWDLMRENPQGYVTLNALLDIE